MVPDTNANTLTVTMNTNTISVSLNTIVKSTLQNCPGGEANKPQEKSDPCRDNEFQCGAYCVMATWVCDGGVDCPNGEDEANCDKECPESHFTCNNKQCILGHLRCNGEKECADGSDESDCRKHHACDGLPNGT